MDSDARFGGLSGDVLVDEIVDDELAERLDVVHRIMFDGQMGRDLSGVAGSSFGTALGRRVRVVILAGPDAHGDTDYIVTLLEQKGGGERAVHSTAHRNIDFLFHSVWRIVAGNSLLNC